MTGLVVRRDNRAAPPYIAPMQSPTASELNERARTVFREIVDSYLASGAPVGSRTLSKLGSLGLSPASIRNVMQDLEELGLLAAPHTSAGRLPTDLGLRMFVDGMMQASEPSADERAAIESGAAGGAAFEDVLARTTAVLSGLSQCAGLVLVPKSEIVIRQLSFVPLAPGKALAVLVGADGTVENRVLDLPPGLPAIALIEAANYINSRLAGQTLALAAERMRAEVAAHRAALDAATATAVAAGLAAWSSDGAARPVLIVRVARRNLVEGECRSRSCPPPARRYRGQGGTGPPARTGARRVKRRRFSSAPKAAIVLAERAPASLQRPIAGQGGRVVGVVGVIGPTQVELCQGNTHGGLHRTNSLSRLVA